MFELKPFQQTPQTQAIKITAQVTVEEGVLQIDFQIQDKERMILFSEVESLGRQDELWKATCFEAFWSEGGQEKYWELNVSTNGNWNVYRFEKYRAPAPPQPEEKIQSIDFKKSEVGNVWSIGIKIPLAQHGLPYKKLDIGLTSVIEFKNNEKSYYAIKHVGSKPDFHQRESFVCNLD